MQSPASILTAVVLSLWGVPLALFASLISLQCFKVLCGLLSDLAGKRFKNDLWRATRPCEFGLFAVPFLQCIGLNPFPEGLMLAADLKGAVAAVEAAFGCACQSPHIPYRALIGALLA